MNTSNFNEINKGSLQLRTLSHTDKNSINELLNDERVSKYYILAPELKKSFNAFIQFADNERNTHRGFGWVIIWNGKFAGYISYSLHQRQDVCRVSFAIKPEYWNQGIATKSFSAIIDILFSNGINRIEADVNQNNIASTRVVEKLGFQTEKGKITIDQALLQSGNFEIEQLVRSTYFLEKPLKRRLASGAKVLNEKDFNSLITGCNVQLIEDRPGTEFLVLNCNTSLKICGIDDDEEPRYHVSWELTHEEMEEGDSFLILTGWGYGPMAPPQNSIFEGAQLAIEKHNFAALVSQIMEINPEMFPARRMQNVNGLENFKFSNGKIYI